MARPVRPALPPAPAEPPPPPPVVQATVLKKHTGKTFGDGAMKKGDPGRCVGPRPKERNINYLLREIGKECATGVPGARTRLEVVLRRVYLLAQRGTPWAVNFIADRTEGKPAQVMVQAGAYYVNGSEAPRDLTLQDLIDLVRRMSGGTLGEDMEESQTITVEESPTDKPKGLPARVAPGKKLQSS